MRCLAPALGALPVEALQLQQPPLELTHTARGFATRQPLEASGALADPLGAQPHERTARDRHDRRPEARVRERVVLELVQHAELQVAPFAYGLALSIALLPAMHTVLGGAAPLIFKCDFLLNGIAG